MLERTLVLCFPEWPVLAHGHLPDEPVAVVATPRIVSCSSTAQRAGVHVGQRLQDAYALCPELVVHESDPGKEARVFSAAVIAMQSLTTAVAHVPGWVAFSTRGPTRYFGGEDALCRIVDEAMREVVLALCPDAARRSFPKPWLIGIADGMFAATQAARRGEIWEKGTTPESLASLPVEILGLSELAESLRHLGIYRLGEFASLDEGDVLARFGNEGAQAHRLAHGVADQHVMAPGLLVEHGAELRFEEPLESVEAATFVGKSLAETLCDRLEEAGLSCSLLEVLIETTTGEQLRGQWSQDGSMSASVIAERLRFQLDAWITERAALENGPPVAIGAIRLVAVEVGPAHTRAIPLWGAMHQSEARVQKVLARVQGMLGADAVLSPVLTGGRGPQERVRLVAFETRLSQAFDDAPWPGRLPAPNPACVLLEPSAAALFDEHGEQLQIDGRGGLSGAPASCSVTGREAVRVIGWAGPWPVDERWWDRSHARRRARLQVLTEKQEVFLLALEHGRWLLEAVYG